MNAGASTSGASAGRRPGRAAVRGQRPRVQPDLVRHGDERQFDKLAEQPQQHLVARRPPHAGPLAHRGVEQPGGDPALAPTIGLNSWSHTGVGINTNHGLGMRIEKMSSVAG